MHHSYHRNGKTDKEAFVRDAIFRQKDTGESTVLHEHPKEDFPGFPACLDQGDHKFWDGGDTGEGDIRDSVKF